MKPDKELWKPLKYEKICILLQKPKVISVWEALKISCLLQSKANFAVFSFAAKKPKKFQIFVHFSHCNRTFLEHKKACFIWSWPSTSNQKLIKNHVKTQWKNSFRKSYPCFSALGAKCKDFFPNNVLSYDPDAGKMDACICCSSHQGRNNSAVY